MESGGRAWIIRCHRRARIGRGANLCERREYYKSDDDEYEILRDFWNYHNCLQMEPAIRVVFSMLRIVVTRRNPRYYASILDGAWARILLVSCLMVRPQNLFVRGRIVKMF